MTTLLALLSPPLVHFFIHFHCGDYRASHLNPLYSVLSVYSSRDDNESYQTGILFLTTKYFKGWLM